jgi:ABC-type glycerol-3-phosphate transport system substrate-binding protein
MLAAPAVLAQGTQEINMIGWNSEPLKEIFARAESEIGVKINYDVLPAKWSDVMQKITLWGQTGYSGIDILFADDLIGGLWGMNGWAEDLSGTNAWAMNQDDVVDNIADLNNAVGGVYRSFFTLGLEPFMFNKSIVPSAPASWEELVAFAKDATDEANGVWGWRPLGGEGHAFNTVLLMLNQAGADIYSLEDPATKTALQFMYDWVQTDKITPPSVVGEDNSVVQALAGAGKAGMWWTYDGGAGQILSVDGGTVTPDTLGAARWPMGPTSDVGLVHGWGLLMSKFSQRKEAATEVINWLAQPELVAEMDVKQGMAPPLKSLFQNEELQAALPMLAAGPGWSELLRGAKFREPIVSSPQVTQLWSMYDQLGSYILSGELNAEEAQAWAVGEYAAIRG